MRLTTEQVAEIRAAEGVYRAGDVARAYEVATSTVTRIWDYQSHLDVRPADEPPNIPTRKYVKDYADTRCLRLHSALGSPVQRYTHTWGYTSDDDFHYVLHRHIPWRNSSKRLR